MSDTTNIVLIALCGLNIVMLALSVTQGLSYRKEVTQRRAEAISTDSLATAELEKLSLCDLHSWPEGFSISTQGVALARELQPLQSQADRRSA